jgi:site-specific recombinase XerD
LPQPQAGQGILFGEAEVEFVQLFLLGADLRKFLTHPLLLIKYVINNYVIKVSRKLLLSFTVDNIFYENDLRDFMQFVGIHQPEDFRTVTRSHVLAWRKTLEVRQLAGATIRRKLAALASLFEHLCESNAVTHNPVKGVKRPVVESQQGKTPALGDAQARSLLSTPDANTLKGKRDRAILSALLYHGLRREELTKLKVRDYCQQRRGVAHLQVQGKGGKTRFVPTHPGTLTLIEEYLEAAGHGQDLDAPLFRPVKNNVHGYTYTAMTPGNVYEQVVLKYLKKLGIAGRNMGRHVMRATAATNALDNGADIAKVQE